MVTSLGKFRNWAGALVLPKETVSIIVRVTFE